MSIIHKCLLNGKKNRLKKPVPVVKQPINLPVRAESLMVTGEWRLSMRLLLIPVL